MKKQITKIKVALIGNMNNNFFGIKRYLEDFGFSCTLFVYKNLPAHFQPINDTWDIEKHRSSIIKLDYGIPHIEFFKKEKKSIFEEFDICIGDGFTPFYFNRMGLKLDIFVPYGSDLSDLPFKKKLRFKSIKQLVYSIVHNLFISGVQKNGILNTTQIITMNNIELLSNAFEKLNRTSLPFFTPMVYNESNKNQADFSPYIDEKRINKFSFRVFSHSRQFWDDGGLESKGSEKLIYGFSLFNKKHKDSCLILFEYGPSVKNSKNLIRELGIENNVVWAKKMPRKYILVLIKKYASIGADQFQIGLFGSTTYELMSQGIPVMNYLNLSPKEFKKKTGLPSPPIINVKTVSEIASALDEFYTNKEKLRQLGILVEKYFHKYLGRGAAIKYKDEIMNLYNKKRHFNN